MRYQTRSLSPKFGFLKRKTSDNFRKKKDKSNFSQTVSESKLLQIIDEEKKILEMDLKSDLEPARRAVLECLDRLRAGANELEEQQIKVETPQFESLINNSKRILITSIKKDSLIGSSEFESYEDAIKFKNNLELLIDRFGQVGDSHNKILNEFMGKKINKLKNEFENLSSLLKQVTKILSVKESQINKCTACRDDLLTYKAKVKDRNEKRNRLSEIIAENEIIDKKIHLNKSEFENFQTSEEFLQTSDALRKINHKKNEISKFEKNFINMVSNLSRPITKFSYRASRETQERLSILQNRPLEIFNDSSQFLLLFNELRKSIDDNSIQIKDPEKTLRQLDDIIDSLPSLSSILKNLKGDLTRLESLVNSTNISRLEDMRAKTKTYEKNRLDNVSLLKLTETNIDELDSAINDLKKRIEDCVQDITNVNYSILQNKDSSDS